MVNYYIWGFGLGAFLLYFLYKQFFSHSKVFLIKIWDVVNDELMQRESYTYPVFKKVKGTNMMAIKGEKETFEIDKMLKPPSYAELKFNAKGKKVYNLAKSKTGSFTPIDSFKMDGKVSIVDAEDDFWKTLSQRQLRERHKDELKWYEKPIFTIALVGLICLMMVYMTVNKASVLVAESRNDVLQMHQDNLDKMGIFHSFVTQLVEGESEVPEAEIPPAPPE